jgi:hypothetical protein
MKLLLAISTGHGHRDAATGLAILCFLAAAAGGFWLVVNIFIPDHKARKK